VYRFRDEGGRIMHIGRSAELRRRVRSYWSVAVNARGLRLRALTAREIVDAALERKPIRTSGRTRDATLAAQLYVRAREQPQGELVKIERLGEWRAERGSVRWVVRLR